MENLPTPDRVYDAGFANSFTIKEWKLTETIVLKLVQDKVLDKGRLSPSYIVSDGGKEYNVMPEIFRLFFKAASGE